MVQDPTTQDLARAAVVTKEQVEAAVDAYFDDPTTRRFPIGASYSLDLAAVVTADRWATTVLRTGGIGARTRRTAVRAAILQARPTQ